MQKNENRPGYKKTKVGWIPDDWDCKQLTKTGLQVIDGDRGNNYPSQSDFFPSEHCLFLNAGNVTSTGFIFKETQFITEERDALLRKGKLIRGDLVVTTRGTIGNFAHFKEDISYEHIRINSGMAIIRNDDKKLDVSFISHFFKSATFEKELQRVTFGSAIPQLTIGLIQKFPLPVSPSLPEQEAIAGVLECWDKGIRKLELKIGKKRRIKKGLMQRLLSGEKRLSGFSGDWKTVRLGEVFNFVKSHAFSRECLTTLEEDNANIFNIHYGDIHATYDGCIVDLSKETRVPLLKTDTELPKIIAFLQDGDLVMADASEDYEGVGACIELIGISERKVTGGLHTFVLRDSSKETSVGYRGYMFSEYALAKELKRICTGVSVYSISKTNLVKVELSLPPVEEQQAIAAVLAAADGEIEVLERKLGSWRDQKKYLLNNLVTGTIRLPQFINH